jgi:benzoyl-CoA reductase/2-hydroxyglutaryl-CoA dehydratase subunit BcrC/BadD/HgdB
MKSEIMDYFEKASEKSLLDLEKVKEDGQKVVGIYCTFAPTELVRAAGAIPVGLCGKKEAPIPEAEKTLPVNLCPLIKSSYGYAVTDTCPFFAASDFLIGETTCDGKKKMFELLGRIKPLFLLQLPYDSSGTTALLYWQKEIYRLKEHLERITGNIINKEALRYQIKINNRIRGLLKNIVYQYAGDNIPITGLDLLPVMESRNFVVDQESYAIHLGQLLKELQELKKQGISSDPPNAPRILLTGCPVGKGSEKVLRLLEDSGSLVVCQENCTGIKSFDRLVDEDEDDPYLAIASYYLQTPCSCMTPNTERFDLIARLIKDFNVQGVVDLTWRCCLAYSIEANLLQEFLEKNGQTPFLHLETDYSSLDEEQLKTRIEAFIEMIVGG